MHTNFPHMPLAAVYFDQLMVLLLPSNKTSRGALATKPKAGLAYLQHDSHGQGKVSVMYMYTHVYMYVAKHTELASYGLPVSWA